MPAYQRHKALTNVKDKFPQLDICWFHHVKDNEKSDTRNRKGAALFFRTPAVCVYVGLHPRESHPCVALSAFTRRR